MQGCPLVGSDAGGMNEIIDHESTGLLFQNEDVDGFCTQVLRLLSDPSFAAALGQRGRRHMLTKHSPSSVAAQTVDYYESIA